MERLLQIGSSALKAAATNQKAKDYLLDNPLLYNLLRKAAERYIGGENLAQALEKVHKTNSHGMKSSLEFMGENVATENQAVEATEEFLQICQHIADQGLNTTISLDLSHIGLNQSSELCLENLLRICQAASPHGIEVNLSAEGHRQTSKVISIYKLASGLTDVLAITLQAYLYRSREDFRELISIPGRIRIVKGAYATPEGLSMPRGQQLNQVYLDYIGELLESGHKCSIATHHDELQQEAKNLIDFYRPKPSHYEFESLFGIQQEQLYNLHMEGYITKLYYVYGKEWYLYLCNRLSEYPLNLFRALADICALELPSELSPAQTC